MKKFSSRPSFPLFKTLIALVVVVSLAVAGLIVVNSYLNKPTQIGSKAAEFSTTIPAINLRETVPAGAVLLEGGTGITNKQAMSQGNFQVEGFCPLKKLGNVKQTQTDWFCGNYKLQVKDFDEICSLTYKNAGAFVIRTGTSSTKAFNWRCYAFPGSGSSSGSSSGIACGQPCGGQNNGVKLPINCANGGVCGNNANGGTTGNRCLPVNAPGYSTVGGNCANDPNKDVYCINKSDGTRVTDVAGLQAACDAKASGGSGSGSGSGSSNSSYNVSDLNKNGKSDTDDYKIFIEDFVKHL
jgi:hypothetical protein